MHRFILSAAICFLLTGTSRASITLITGGPGTTHAGNLVTNGSFELGAPASGTANQVYWATGTSLTPFSSPPGWTTSGASPAYAVWGNDGTVPPSLKGSDSLPDGKFALYMGNGTGASVNVAPTFNIDGSVTFASNPTFGPKYGAPVTLAQTIPTNANPAVSYEMSFWLSGEDAQTGLFAGDPGILELDVSNVIIGGPTRLFVAVPNGATPQPLSRVYEYNFVPINPSLPVTIEFLNWGHLNLAPFGGSSLTTEANIDDVIVNAIPEPCLALLLFAAILGSNASLWRSGGL